MRAYLGILAFFLAFGTAHAGQASAPLETAALLEQAQSQDLAARRAAVKTLALEYRKRSLGNEALPILKMNLSHPDAAIRTDAALAIGGIASLVHIASRSAAGTAFGRPVSADLRSEPDLLEALLKALSDPAPKVRENSAAALGFGYPPSAAIEKALLKRLKKEKTAPLKRAILIALDKGGYTSDAVQRSVKKALKDKDPLVRRSAEAALAGMRKTGAAQP
jgi:HEAT repeat protein